MVKLLRNSFSLPNMWGPFLSLFYLLMSNCARPRDLAQYHSARFPPLQPLRKGYYFCSPDGNDRLRSRTGQMHPPFSSPSSPPLSAWGAEIKLLLRTWQEQAKHREVTWPSAFWSRFAAHFLELPQLLGWGRCRDPGGALVHCFSGCFEHLNPSDPYLKLWFPGDPTGASEPPGLSPDSPSESDAQPRVRNTALIQPVYQTSGNPIPGDQVTQQVSDRVMAGT